MEVKDRRLSANEMEILREAIIDYGLFTSDNSSEEPMRRSLSKIKEKIDNNNVSLLSDITLDSVFLVPALKKYNKYLSQCVRESYSEDEKTNTDLNCIVAILYGGLFKMCFMKQLEIL